MEADMVVDDTPPLSHIPPAFKLPDITDESLQKTARVASKIMSEQLGVKVEARVFTKYAFIVIFETEEKAKAKVGHVIKANYTATRLEIFRAASITRVSFCKTCCRYGHSTKSCTVPTEKAKCLACGIVGHGLGCSECKFHDKNETHKRKCIICHRMGHYAGSNKCSATKVAQEKFCSKYNLDANNPNTSQRTPSSHAPDTGGPSNLATPALAPKPNPARTAAPPKVPTRAKVSQVSDLMASICDELTNASKDDLLHTFQVFSTQLNSFMAVVGQLLSVPEPTSSKPKAQPKAQTRSNGHRHPEDPKQTKISFVSTPTQTKTASTSGASPSNTPAKRQKPNSTASPLQPTAMVLAKAAAVSNQQASASSLSIQASEQVPLHAGSSSSPDQTPDLLDQPVASIALTTGTADTSGSPSA